MDKLRACKDLIEQIYSGDYRVIDEVKKEAIQYIAKLAESDQTEIIISAGHFHIFHYMGILSFNNGHIELVTGDKAILELCRKSNKTTDSQSVSIARTPMSVEKILAGFNDLRKARNLISMRTAEEEAKYTIDF